MQFKKRDSPKAGICNVCPQRSSKGTIPESGEGGRIMEEQMYERLKETEELLNDGIRREIEDYYDYDTSSFEDFPVEDFPESGDL